MEPLNSAGLFLIRTLFELYLLAVCLRVIIHWVRAGYFDPIGQFTFTVTEPILRPLRQLIPNVGPLDAAALVLGLVLEFVKILLLAWLSTKITPPLLGLFIIACGELAGLFVTIFFYAIFIYIVLSWVTPPGSRHPIVDLLHRVTAALLEPAKRFIPPIGGIDLSPIVVLIGLKLIEILFIAPLTSFGLTLAR